MDVLEIFINPPFNFFLFFNETEFEQCQYLVMETNEKDIVYAIASH